LTAETRKKRKKQGPGDWGFAVSPHMKKKGKRKKKESLVGQVRRKRGGGE